VRRGDLYWAELRPRSGSEQQGRRPVIVLSHNGFNESPTWRSIIVIPCTTSAAQSRRGPTVVPLARGNCEVVAKFPAGGTPIRTWIVYPERQDPSLPLAR
jgi:mRNA-degrading endonuclease toxin of MazEF toxin-antitoxin module